MKIAIDAGHGQKSYASLRRRFSGACANNLVEDVIALDIANRFAHHLRAKGFNTFLTRPNDTFVSLKDRVTIAKKEECDMFISIHCNCASASASGIEAFIAAGDKKSEALANKFVDKLSKLGFKNRGVKPDNKSQHSKLYVLQNLYKKMPAVLLEVGFLSNELDAKKLSDANVREMIAMSCSQVIIEGL